VPVLISDERVKKLEQISSISRVSDRTVKKKLTSNRSEKIDIESFVRKFIEKANMRAIKIVMEK